MVRPQHRTRAERQVPIRPGSGASTTAATADENPAGVGEPCRPEDRVDRAHRVDRVLRVTARGEVLQNLTAREPGATPPLAHRRDHDRREVDALRGGRRSGEGQARDVEPVGPRPAATIPCANSPHSNVSSPPGPSQPEGVPPRPDTRRRERRRAPPNRQPPYPAAADRRLCATPHFPPHPITTPTTNALPFEPRPHTRRRPDADRAPPAGPQPPPRQPNGKVERHIHPPGSRHQAPPVTPRPPLTVTDHPHPTRDGSPRSDRIRTFLQSVILAEQTVVTAPRHP